VVNISSGTGSPGYGHEMVVVAVVLKHL